MGIGRISSASTAASWKCVVPLADGVEVVDQFHARPLARHGEAGFLAVVVERDGGDPVGIEGAGAVVLGALHAEPFAVAPDARTDIAMRTAALDAAVAEDVAGQQPGEDVPALGFGAGKQQALDDAEVGPQSLRDVGIHRRQLDDEADDVVHGAAGSAVGFGNAKGQQPGLRDAAYQDVGQFATLLAFSCFGADLRQQLRRAGEQARRIRGGGRSTEMRRRVRRGEGGEGFRGAGACARSTVAHALGRGLERHGIPGERTKILGCRARAA